MPETTPALRVGDAEREQTAAVLGQHVAAGRLDLAEFERRLDVVYAARTHDDLRPALSDLPAPAVPHLSAPVTRSGPTAAAVWAPWALTGVICLVIWVLTSVSAGHALYFWPVWVIGPWGGVLLLGSVGARAACGVRPAAPRTPA